MSKPTLPFSRFLRPTSPSDSSRAEQGYLLGVRGFLVIQTFLWVFLQTFLPTAVKDSANASGPLYAKVLRDTFSVLFWNEGLLYSAFILLSARTVCIPFISNPSKVAVASAVFRRGLRLWFPVAVSLALVKIPSSAIGTAYIDQFRTHTGNITINTPILDPQRTRVLQLRLQPLLDDRQILRASRQYCVPVADAMGCQRYLRAELHCIHDHGHYSIHSQRMAREGIHLLHHYSMVGAVLGMVFHHWSPPRGYGHEHAL